MEKTCSQNKPDLTREMMQLIFGQFVSQSLLTAAKMGVAEALSNGPMDVAELAQAVNADAGALGRLLRALASVGVFQERSEGRFANTELSKMLQLDVPASMKNLAQFLCGPELWLAWGELEYSIRSGRSAFEKVHGAHPFEYMKQCATFGSIFNSAMTGLSEQEVEAIHAKYDFSQFPTLVDIAGGCGALLVSCLRRNPSQRGVLFDRQSVLEEARAFVDASGVSARCEIVVGDFFQRVPSGGDAYMMKYILHDWSDEECLVILKNIQRATRPGARLLVMDPIIRSGNSPDLGKFMDLQMLVFYGTGRERTLQELSGLMTAAGFAVSEVIHTGAAVSIIDAVRQ